MKMTEEFVLDFDVTSPKIIANTGTMIIENVRKAIQISDTAVTVDAGRFFVTVKGQEFVISELMEGRMELAGKIETIEFYKPLG